MNELAVSQVISTQLSDLKSDRLQSTALAGLLSLAGLLLCIPACITENPVSTVEYCTNPCKELHKKIAVAEIIHSERLNSSYFKKNTVILETQQADYPNAGITGLMGFVLLGAGFGVFTHQTKKELAMLHHRINHISKEVHISDLAAAAEIAIAQTEIDAQTSQLTGQAAMFVLNSLPDAAQQALGVDIQQQMQLSALQHQLQVQELEQQALEAQLKQKEIQVKIKKLSTSSKKDKSDKSENLETLLQAIKAHEDGWLWNLVNDLKPLLLVGDQGSGKTSTAATLCFLREQLGAEIHYLLDHHYEGANRRAWDILKPASVAANDNAIDLAMQEIVSWWGNRIASDAKDTKQVLVDEFTHLHKSLGETCQSFIDKAFTDTRKAGCQLLLITHTLTNNTFGAGTAETRKQGSICLRRYSANGKTPLPRVSLVWGAKAANGDALENVDYTLPSWFRPELVKAHLDGKLLDF